VGVCVCVCCVFGVSSCVLMRGERFVALQPFSCPSCPIALTHVQRPLLLLRRFKKFARSPHEYVKFDSLNGDNIFEW
jgi:hypothetical protein